MTVLRHRFCGAIGAAMNSAASDPIDQAGARGTGDCQVAPRRPEVMPRDDRRSDETDLA